MPRRSAFVKYITPLAGRVGESGKLPARPTWCESCCTFNTTGKSLRFDGIVSSPGNKNILLYRSINQVHNCRVLSPTRGTFRDRHHTWAQDAMDAVASGVFHRTKTLTAYGEIVWSWRRDPGATP